MDTFYSCNFILQFGKEKMSIFLISLSIVFATHFLTMQENTSMILLLLLKKVLKVFYP